MKKNLFIVAAAAAIVFGMSSCSKAECYECTNMGAASTICQEDYEAAGGTDWGAYSAGLAASPYCKKVKK